MSRVSLAGGRVDETVDTESVHRISQDPVRTWEVWWQRGGELANPILVKEVRQALKSRQFEVSFGLTLLAAVCWTLLFMSINVPRMFYTPGAGAELLRGYAFILLVPLLIIIPFSAFRSLTSEVEESTFELLSITSLSAKQIVTGKMATAALQILLFVSALTPYIVLTYMLRGVSLFAILILMGTTIVYSIMLVSVALLVATVARTRSGQSGMSVLLLALLVISFFSFSGVVGTDSIEQIVAFTFTRTTVIWLFAFVTILMAVFSLMMQTAAAAIDFPSENKSTPIRKRLLILLGVLLFWFSMFLAFLSTQRMDSAADVSIGALIVLFVAWSAIGTLICGERGVISPRAQRSLPATFFGRALLTWLSPGAGLGYVFIVVVYASVAVVLVGVVQFLPNGARGSANVETLAAVGYALTCFLAFYLGICRLCMLAIGRNNGAPMVVSVSLMVVLNLAIQVVPYYVASYFNDFTRVSYEWHQALNVPLAITGILAGGWSTFLLNLIVLSLAAIAVFGLNLLLTTKDVMVIKISAPERVLRETSVAPAMAAAPADPFSIE